MSKIDTIDKIIEAATAEISLKGIDGARIEKIGRDAGVTKQLVYHYFKTKDELYRAVLESVSRDLKLLANIHDYKTLAPEDAIALMVKTIFSEFVRNPNYTTFALDQTLHDGEHITRGSHFVPNMRIFISDVVAGVLARGERQGVFKSGLNPHTTFWMIFNLSAGCFLNRNITAEISQLDFEDELTLESWQKETVAFVLNAIRA
jgi:AcrR family transcriptional regulator